MTNLDQVQKALKKIKMNFKNIENFSEVDCLIHLRREFGGAKIEKLPRKKGLKTCDFKVLLPQPHYVEVKEIRKFAEKTLKKYATYALEQIEASAKQDAQKDYCAVVWIFTHDTYCEGQGAQEMVEKVKSELRKNYPVLLTVQTYDKCPYGDATFRNSN